MGGTAPVPNVANRRRSWYTDPMTKTAAPAAYADTLSGRTLWAVTDLLRSIEEAPATEYLTKIDASPLAAEAQADGSLVIYRTGPGGRVAIATIEVAAEAVFEDGTSGDSTRRAIVLSVDTLSARGIDITEVVA